MKFFYDTEFLEDGSTIELISIGIVSEDDREYFACATDSDWKRISQDAWLKQHVLPNLPPTGDPSWKPKAQIAKEIVEFVGDNPEFWADYAAYDHIVLCQLYGKMIHLPDGWPMFTHEIQQLKETAGIVEFPEMQDNSHEALSDARETKARFDMCMSKLGKTVKKASVSQVRNRPCKFQRIK